ncbi:SETD1A isoform 2, partial [Pongo abelii]
MGRRPRASSGGTTSSSWILPWTLPCAGLLRRCTAMMESTSVSTTQSIYQSKISKTPVAMSGPK